MVGDGIRANKIIWSNSSLSQGVGGGLRADFPCPVSTACAGEARAPDQPPRRAEYAKNNTLTGYIISQHRIEIPPYQANY